MSSLGIGTSALLAFQRALNVTSHNIANSTTEGYSRQRIDLTARQPQFIGNGFLGKGTEIAGIERIADQFIERQLRSATSANEEYSVYYDFAQRVDSLLADPDSGLSPGLQRFFNSVQDVTNDPTATAARQVMLTEADSLVDRLKFLDNRLTEQRELLNGQITTTVQEINGITENLAQLNTDIVSASARGTRSPNDLLDQRETLLRDLAERVEISTFTQDNGAINVFIGSGQGVVIGNQAVKLTPESQGEDSRRAGVSLVASGGSNIDLSNVISGGRLGALLDLRSSVLDESQNALGRIAIGLAQEFNDQHKLGFDLDGNLGQDFFQVPEPEVLAGRNAAEGEPKVRVTDISGLTTDDYQLRFDDSSSEWIVRREPGGQLVDSIAAGASKEIEGLTIDLSVIGGTPAKGDSFLIRPTRTAAQQFGTLISDPREIAASRGVNASADSANTAEGLPVLQVTDASLLAEDDYKLSFDGTDWNLFDSDDNPLTQIDGVSIDTTGITNPAAGDTFDIEVRLGTVGDNGNALDLAALQDKLLLDGENATFEGGYNTLIAEVGTNTRRAQVASQAQERLLAEAQGQRDSLSGVNLDEEAANLVRYQQAYQAAAQVIATTSSLFDTLLSVVRR
jgi:flagellar hook-associated protein 1 FlgK